MDKNLNKSKRWLFLVLAFSVVSLVTSHTSLFAAPERLEIKNSSKRAKEQAAKAQIKNIDLGNIEDPEARKAIREIFNYLNLQAK